MKYVAPVVVPVSVPETRDCARCGEEFTPIWGTALTCTECTQAYRKNDPSVWIRSCVVCGVTYAHAADNPDPNASKNLCPYHRMAAKDRVTRRTCLACDRRLWVSADQLDPPCIRCGGITYPDSKTRARCKSDTCAWIVWLIDGDSEPEVCPVCGEGVEVYEPSLAPRRRRRANSRRCPPRIYPSPEIMSMTEAEFNEVLQVFSSSCVCHRTRWTYDWHSHQCGNCYGWVDPPVYPWRPCKGGCGRLASWTGTSPTWKCARCFPAPPEWFRKKFRKRQLRDGVLIADTYEFTRFRRGQVVKATTVSGSPTPAQRKAVWEGEECVYCGDPAQAADHVFPRARGGWDVLDNLAPACKHCNAVKHDRLLTEWQSAEVIRAIRVSDVVARSAVRELRIAALAEMDESDIDGAVVPSLAAARRMWERQPTRRQSRAACVAAWVEFHSPLPKKWTRLWLELGDDSVRNW